MIILACLALGLLLRVIAGRRLPDLAHVHLRGETALLVLLVVQALLPLVRLSGTAARLGFLVWLATFPMLLGVAWVNRSQMGMVVLGVGLALNFTVIALNGGMPVFAEAVAGVSSAAGAGAIPAGDFVHVLGTAGTRLPWLADVIPLPGPSWLRSVPSAGDLLLYVGVMGFLVGAEPAMGEVHVKGK